ncbi:uridine diphosphate-N-acetylglucosamine-binding protein YvcK [Spongorhabdus nitratireducens]
MIDTVKALYQCRQVVAIGGGHGLGRVMASLGFLGEKLAGIVATTDDGGSTGRLRQASGCIAWGDLRNCLNQLCADSPNLARILFEYRFKESGELTGHNLGNLILLGMDQMCVRPLDAVNLIRQMLQVKAHLIPMSEEPASLGAEFEGQCIIGETTIDGLDKMPSRLFVMPEVQAPEEAIQAIRDADLIILGPGSFMTSVMPALLLPNVANELKASKALKVFIANVRPENTPVGRIGTAGKLQWLEQQTGIKPDVLLWPNERGEKPDLDINVTGLDLEDVFQKGVHSREGLRHALDDLMFEYLGIGN